MIAINGYNHSIDRISAAALINGNTTLLDRVIEAQRHGRRRAATEKNQGRQYGKERMHGHAGRFCRSEDQEWTRKGAVRATFNEDFVVREQLAAMEEADAMPWIEYVPTVALMGADADPLPFVCRVCGLVREPQDGILDDVCTRCYARGWDADTVAHQEYEDEAWRAAQADAELLVALAAVEFLDGPRRWDGVYCWCCTSTPEWTLRSDEPGLRIPFGWSWGRHWGKFYCPRCTGRGCDARREHYSAAPCSNRTVSRRREIQDLAAGAVLAGVGRYWGDYFGF